MAAETPEAALAALTAAVHASGVANCTAREDEDDQRSGMRPACERAARYLWDQGVRVSPDEGLDVERLARALLTQGAQFSDELMAAIAAEYDKP